MTEAKRVYRIQSIERAVRILDLMAELAVPLRLQQVAEATGLHKSTAYRFLNVLAASGLAEVDRDGRWHLGWKIGNLGNAFARDVRGVGAADSSQLTADRKSLR